MNKMEKTSAIDQFFKHSKAATKKTFNSFICLSVLLILSFAVSSYEIHTQQVDLQAMVAKPAEPKHEAPLNLTGNVLTEIPLNQTEPIVVIQKEEEIEEDSKTHSHHHHKKTRSKAHEKAKNKKHSKKNAEITEVSKEDLMILDHMKHYRNFNMTEFLQDGTSAIKDAANAVKNVNVSKITNAIKDANYSSSLDDWKQQVMQTT